MTRVVLTLAMAALLWTMASRSAAGQVSDATDAARLLRGAIDIHVHSLPDDRPRSIDAFDMAKLASARGMRAIAC